MRRHIRFWVAFAVGLVVSTFSFLQPMAPAMRALLGADAFFVVYLMSTLRLAHTLSPDTLRQTVEQDDEGLPFILVLATAVIAISLASVFLMLTGATSQRGVAKGLALGSVPLGWAMLHLVLAFHYAHLFYRADASGIKGGLTFPGTKTPGPWDFIYFSFGVGMTAQVSDVVTTSSGMRKVVTGHAIASFFYNAVILALTVNAAITAGR